MWSREKHTQFLAALITSLTIITIPWIVVRFSLDAYTLMSFLFGRIGGTTIKLMAMFQKGDMSNSSNRSKWF